MDGLFGDDWGEPVKRRKSWEVARARKSWEEKIDERFRSAMDRLKWQGIVTSEQLRYITLSDPKFESHGISEALKTNMTKSMKRLGYFKLNNEKAKDGRWKVEGFSVTVYVNEKARAEIGVDRWSTINAIKQAL